jgi:prepilin-type N-terminal cleavage/methylation domain-containing protein
MKDKGYSLIELMVAIFLVGLLSAIAIPSWLSFWQKQQIRDASEKLYLALARAKSESRKKLIRHAVTVCSRGSDDGQDEMIKYSIHPYSSVPAQFTKIHNVSVVKSTVRRSPPKYQLSKLNDSDCYTTYLGLFPDDGYALGFFYISQNQSQYVYRVGFNTLIGNIATCPVISRHQTDCR